MRYPAPRAVVTEIVSPSDNPLGGKRWVHVEAAALTRRKVYYACPFCCYSGSQTSGSSCRVPPRVRRKNGRAVVHVHSNVCSWNDSWDAAKGVVDVYRRCLHCTTRLGPRPQWPADEVLIYVTGRTMLMLDKDELTEAEISDLSLREWRGPYGLVLRVD